jgi:hypothetical protein
MTKNFTFLIVHGRYHVLADSTSRDNSTIPPANYRGTGKALHAVMRKEDTPAAWLERYDDNHSKKGHKQ